MFKTIYYSGEPGVDDYQRVQDVTKDSSFWVEFGDYVGTYLRVWVTEVGELGDEKFPEPQVVLEVGENSNFKKTPVMWYGTMSELRGLLERNQEK